MGCNQSQDKLISALSEIDRYKTQYTDISKKALFYESE